MIDVSDLTDSAGDAFGASLAQNFMCFHLWRSGQTEECFCNLEEARVRAEASGNLRASMSYHWLCQQIEAERGEIDRFLGHREAVRRLQLDHCGSEPSETLWSRNDLGFALYCAGRMVDARDALAPAVDDCRARGEVVAGIWDEFDRSMDYGAARKYLDEMGIEYVNRKVDPGKGFENSITMAMVMGDSPVLKPFSFCGTPSSSTRKFPAGMPGMKRPLLSRTPTSTVTESVSARKVGA